MKGILEDCRTKEKRDIEIDYEVVFVNGERIFRLIGGVTGYESFCIDSKYTNLAAMCEGGWLACAGTEGKYDRLTIPAEDMKKALKTYVGDRKVVLKEIVISSCRECPHLKYTESNWYCEEMKLSKHTWREVVDINKIHDLCPLKDYVRSS